MAFHPEPVAVCGVPRCWLDLGSCSSLVLEVCLKIPFTSHEHVMEGEGRVQTELLLLCSVIRMDKRHSVGGGGGCLCCVSLRTTETWGVEWTPQKKPDNFQDYSFVPKMFCSADRDTKLKATAL